MEVSFNGIGEKLVSFKNVDAQPGQVVKMAAAAAVGACGQGERFEGVALYVEDGLASVRLGGFVTLPYTGAAPAIGRNHLLANGQGGVMVDGDQIGGSYLVVKVDEAAGTVTFYM